MHRVIVRLDIQCTAADIYKSDCVVLIIFRVERILVCLDVDRAVRDPYGVIGFDRIRRACDVDCSARDFEIVFACDPVIR